MVDRGVALPPVIGTARLWVAAGRAHGLRRLGRVRRPLRLPGAGDGDELEIDLRSLDTVARWVAGYGPDVVVLHPPELAAAVRRAWATVAAGARRRSRLRNRIATPRSTPACRRRADAAVSQTGLAERLPRLLSLVPYLLARPGVPLADVAADFGIGERQLRRDLELLWMCGLPGYGPGDLVDLSFSGDTVTVTEDAGMRRPLRLTTAEGTALLVALRTLGDLPGMVDTDAVRRATAKIERAVGDAGAGGVAVEVSRQEQATTAAVREALEAGRALRIRYYTAGRDDVTRRTVDPMRLLLVEGRGYLEAWCRRAGAVRLFRLDRVDDVAVLDEPAAAPPDAAPTDLSGGVFPARPEHGSAVLLLEPWARWVAEYYPVEQVVEIPPEHAPPSRTAPAPGMITGTVSVTAARAGPGCCCATPTRRGWSGWCWAWAGERGSWSRPSSRRRWPGARRRPWRRPTGCSGPGRTAGSGRRERDGSGAGMTGVVGALVALAVVVALVLVLGVRPHVRRLTRSVAALRADTAARLGRLQAIRAEAPRRR